jgi:hypothetical protein
MFFWRGSNWYQSLRYAPLLISLFRCENCAKLRSVQAIENWSSMPIMHARIRRRWFWNFWSITRWKEYIIHRTHLIWHPLTSIAYLLSLISYLFGYIKQLLMWHEFSHREALLEAVRHILEVIEKVSLDLVFLAWMERFEWHIKPVEITSSKEQFDVKSYY